MVCLSSTSAQRFWPRHGVRDTDQMTVYQSRFVGVVQPGDFHRPQADMAFVPALRGCQHLLCDGFQLRVTGTTGKRRPGQVPRQPDTGRQNDIRFPAGLPRPRWRRRGCGCFCAAFKRSSCRGVGSHRGSPSAHARLPLGTPHNTGCSPSAPANTAHAAPCRIRGRLHFSPQVLRLGSKQARHPRSSVSSKRGRCASVTTKPFCPERSKVTSSLRRRFSRS